MSKLVHNVRAYTFWKTENRNNSAAVWTIVTNSSNGCRVIAFCGKNQNGGVRHFEFVFGNSGPPTKLTYGPEVAQKIWCQWNFYFSRYRDFKILKIGLKTPIQAPKIYVFGVRPGRWAKNTKKI